MSPRHKVNAYLLLAVLAFWQLSVWVHFAGTKHEICDHEDTSHSHYAHHVKTADGTQVGDRPAHGEDKDDDHDACELLTSLIRTSTTLNQPAFPVSAPTVQWTAVDFYSLPTVVSKVAIFRLSPAQSPPCSTI